MGYIEEIGARSKAAAADLMKVKTLKKNEVLNFAADMLVENAAKLIEANEKDVIAAKEKNVSEGLVDRLVLNEKRIEQMAVGLRQVAELKDVTGEVLSMETRPNGLVVGKKRVPIGVIGIIGLGLTQLIIEPFAVEGIFGKGFFVSNQIFGSLLPVDKYYIVGKVLAVIIVYMWNFFARKFILYRNAEK